MKKRVSLISLLLCSVLLLGIDCSRSTGDIITDFFSGDRFEDGPVIPEPKPQPVPPTNSILDDLGPGAYTNTTNTETNENLNLDEELPLLNLTFDQNQNSQESTNQPYTNSEVSSNTTLWAFETDLHIGDPEGYITWKVQVMELTQAAGQETVASPSVGSQVIVEFIQGGASVTETGITGAAGWVSWAKPIPNDETTMTMYMRDIQGSYAWDPDDKAYAEINPALTYTAAVD